MLSLFQHMTTAEIISFLAMYIVPQISAFLTSHPNGWTSTWTVVLAAGSDIAAQLSGPNFDWKAAIGQFALNIGMAFLGRWHIGNTTWEAWLHSHGFTGMSRANANVAVNANKAA